MISIPRHGLTIIIEVTDRCQLNCGYCISPRQDRDIADVDVVAMIRGIAELVPRTMPLSFVWHGGEPLLRGPDYFQWIKEIQIETLGPDRVFYNKVQTNGLLIDESMIDFMKESGDFYPTISMDGPDAVTNSTRGVGVDDYDSLFSRLQEREIPFGVSVVGTPLLLEHLDSVEDYFQQHKVSRVGVVPLITGAGSTDPLPSPDLLADIALRSQPKRKDGSPSVTLPGWSIIGPILHQFRLGTPLWSSFTDGCHRHVICLAPDGRLYTCPRGRCVGLWSYGHVQEGALDNWWAATAGPPPFRPSLPAECVGCPWVEACHGGCPANALSMNGGPNKRDIYCSSYKRLFEYAEQNCWRDYLESHPFLPPSALMYPHAARGGERA